MEDNFYAEESEMHFFGCSSSVLYNKLQNSIKTAIEDELNQFKNILLEEACLNEMDVGDIETQVYNVCELYNNRASEVLQTFKPTLKSIFKIAPNVDIYSELTNDMKENYTDEQIEILRQGNEELEQQYLREKLFLKELKTEMELQEKLEYVSQQNHIISDELKRFEEKYFRMETLQTTHELACSSRNAQDEKEGK